MKYLISYDLVEPPTPRDYKPLEDRLVQHGARRILFSEWIVESALTHIQLRDDLQRFLQPSDRILVVVIAAPAAWSQLQIASDDFKAFLNNT